MDFNQLMESEKLHFQKLQELVESTIKEERLLTTKLVEAEQEYGTTLGERLADKIADLGGSWYFIMLFGFGIFVWILINSISSSRTQFDPYPYILLNLILSCIAAIQAPVIMMSQNRQENKDRRRSRSDFLVNLKAELEVRGLHSKIDLLMADQMKSLFEFQKIQLDLLKEINHKLVTK